MPDRVPFTVYECIIPQCEAERQLRNDGLCIVKRDVPVVTRSTPNVSTETRHYSQDGVSYVRTDIRTPVGDLHTVERPADFTSWTVRRLFKGPEDYKALRFLVEDERYEPNYEEFLKAERDFGEDAIFRAAIGATPLHQIMIHWMGVETFAVEWVERRDEILSLCDAMVGQLRRIYPLVAKSPALHANYGGNEVPEVMGLERFKEYVVPLWNEAAEVFHKHGKLVGSHLDGNNKLWAREVAESALDYVEAFTPAPDTDMSVAEALQAWPDKVLWINYPSSVHVASVERIEETSRQMLREAAPGDRFIMGVTEDVPKDRWQQNLLAISRVIDEHGKLPIR
jgi:hypothetical protein